jgi:hypothetical protein
MLVRKFEAACHQLDWAIRLLVDFGQPIPAITLASAAEELLGKAVGDGSAHESLVKTFMASHGLERKAVSQGHLNRAKNWLKHWDYPTEPEEADFDLTAEAVNAIARAMINMAEYDKSTCSEGQRFLAWAREWDGNGP